MKKDGYLNSYRTHKKLAKISKLMVAMVLTLACINPISYYFFGLSAVSLVEQENIQKKLKFITNPELIPENKRAKDIYKARSFKQKAYFNSPKYKNVLMRTSRLKMGGKKRLPTLAFELT